MEALKPSEDGLVAAPKKYPDELRERAVRMVMDLRKDPLTARGAMARVSQQLAVNKDTLRNWVHHEEIDSGLRPGVTSSEQRRIDELEREVRELRRANEILKSASAFFAAELDRPRRH
jgi:transposase